MGPVCRWVLDLTGSEDSAEPEHGLEPARLPHREHHDIERGDPIVLHDGEEDAVLFRAADAPFASGNCAFEHVDDVIEIDAVVPQVAVELLTRLGNRDQPLKGSEAVEVDDPRQIDFRSCAVGESFPHQSTAANRASIHRSRSLSRHARRPGEIGTERGKLPERSSLQTLDRLKPTRLCTSAKPISLSGRGAFDAMASCPEYWSAECVERVVDDISDPILGFP